MSGDLLKSGAPIGSFVVAAVALTISYWVNRRQRQAARLDIARGLHSEIISDSAMEHRHTLGTIHWQNRAIEPSGRERNDVMKAYFAMLWRFERLYLGRKVLLDENKGRHDLALTVLDAQILPHVIDYACTFHEIKTKLTNSNPDDVVYDDAYCSAFKALRHSLREKADEATRQKLLRHEDRSQRDCYCSCHEVGPKSALPGTGAAS